MSGVTFHFSFLFVIGPQILMRFDLNNTRLDSNTTFNFEDLFTAGVSLNSYNLIVAIVHKIPVHKREAKKALSKLSTFP